MFLRQENFVNPFVASTPDFLAGRPVMASEAIENIPSGFRAREPYTFGAENAFEDFCEIVEPNSDLQRYS